MFNRYGRGLLYFSVFGEPAGNRQRAKFVFHLLAIFILHVSYRLRARRAMGCHIIDREKNAVKNDDETSVLSGSQSKDV